MTLRGGMLAVLKMEAMASVNEYSQEYYDERNKLVLLMVGAAADAGIPVGFRLDENEPEWPVVYFELPTGQVSWHLPRHVREWDGHDTTTKHYRINEWLKS